MDGFELTRLFSNVQKARAQWEQAGDVLLAATALSRNLEAGSPDGAAALRKARLAHVQARENYTAAVRTYADAVIRKNQGPTSEH